MAIIDHVSISRKPQTLSLIDLHNWLKRIFVFTLLVFGLVCSVKLASADTIQHRWAGDVPIMNGFLIEPELGFAFDSPDGRIVMIFAASTMPTSKIMGFYDSTLAQLGWNGGAGNWTRGNEKLLISAVETARGPLWRIMLQPN